MWRKCGGSANLCVGEDLALEEALERIGNAAVVFFYGLKEVLHMYGLERDAYVVDFTHSVLPESALIATFRGVGLVSELLHTAGCVDVACKVEKIRRFLVTNYRCDGSLDAPWSQIPIGVDPVLWFLKEGRRGVCIHFASAFVLLTGVSGVPARLVVCYVSDGPVLVEWAPLAFSPHAWAEYYDCCRWIGVETTPGGGVPAPLLPALPPAVASLPQPPQPETPQLPPLTGASLPGWILPVVLAAAGAVAALTSLRRVVTVAVGEEVEFGAPAASPSTSTSGWRGTPVRVRFEGAGTYLARVGPVVYVVRVVDYRRLAGRCLQDFCVGSTCLQR